jgi:hypothetical protein
VPSNENYTQSFWQETSSKGAAWEKVDRRMILKLILREIGCEVWTGFSWLNTGSNGFLL